MAKTNNSVTVAATSTAVLSAPTISRALAVLCNDSTQVIYLGIGAAAVLNKGIRLAPQEKIILNGEDYEAAEVFAICASGSANLSFYENSI